MKDLKRETAGPALEPLILEMTKGSTEALSAVYEQTKTSVYAFALSIIGDRHSAEDIMQETYIKAFQNAGSYTPMGKPMAWLLTITKNLALMKFRTESGRNEALDETLPSPGFEECTLDRLTLQTALNALSEEERQIVTLHAIAGMKHREIAGMLGLPLATVLSKYHRSLSKLKKLLKEEGHVDERDEHRAPLARARGAGDP